MALVLAVLALGCQDDVWHDGHFESAKAEAAARGTLVMVSFSTDW
jgi:hypothetical protein